MSDGEFDFGFKFFLNLGNGFLYGWLYVGECGCDCVCVGYCGDLGVEYFL